MRAGCGAQAIFLILRDRSIDGHSGDAAGRGFDDAGLDASLADALGQLMDVDISDIVGADGAKMLWDAERVVVEAGGNDDAHPGFRGDFGGKFGIAAEFHRTRIHEAVDAEILDLLHPIDGLAHFHFAIEAAIVELPTGEAGGQMLVNEREAEVARFALAHDSVNRHFQTPYVAERRWCPRNEYYEGRKV